jgi:predicted DNA-binding protein (UPF0251 family)
MNALTETVQILRDKSGHPTFAVLAFADYQALVHNKPKAEPGIPLEVVDKALAHEWSAARAWREYLDLTQTDVAQRMGITQGSYAQLEAKKTVRKSSREKIAKALGIDESQLDF